MIKKRFILLMIFTTILTIQAQEDPYLWLEEIESEKALEFVTAQSKITQDKLSNSKVYEDIYNKCLEIYNSSDKLILPSTTNEFVYNFWKDEKNERGIWRRSLKTKYLEGKPEWETLLDIDELSRKDSINWVYTGASGLYPTYDRFMVSLSKGGSDATIKKEFDVNTKQFIENGFYIPESKGGASYVDENTLIISSDFGENTLTTHIRISKTG